MWLRHGEETPVLLLKALPASSQTSFNTPLSLEWDIFHLFITKIFEGKNLYLTCSLLYVQTGRMSSVNINWTDE